MQEVSILNQKGGRASRPLVCHTYSQPGMKKGLHMAQCKIKRGREKIVHFMLLLQVTEKNTVNLQQVSNVC